MRTTQLTVAVAVCLVVCCAGASVVPLASQGHRHYSGFITFDNILPGLRRIVFGPDPSTTTQESDAVLVKTVTPTTSTDTVVVKRRETSTESAVIGVAAERPAPANPRLSGHVISTSRPNAVIWFPGARPTPSFPIKTPSPTHIPVDPVFPSENLNPADPAHGNDNIWSISPNSNRRVNTDHQTDNCTHQNGKAVYQGTCQRLMMQGLCADGEWLVLTDDAPVCVPRPCPFGELQYRGKCVDSLDMSVCRKGQILYVDLTGFTMCDCDQGHTYDSASGNCYAEHEQGPCGVGEYLETSDAGLVECVPNYCVIDGLVQDPTSKVCFKKMYYGYCASRFLIFHKVNNTAECENLNVRTILGVTTVRACSPGSKRDHLRQCRQEFRIPSVSSFPSFYGECGTGYIKDPSGTCRRSHRLFG